MHTLTTTSEEMQAELPPVEVSHVVAMLEQFLQKVGESQQFLHWAAHEVQGTEYEKMFMDLFEGKVNEHSAIMKKIGELRGS